MAAFVDHYHVLGVAPAAELAEIRRAYRRAVHQHHADRRPDDAAASERMRAIVTARDVLCDPQRRARFDLARQGRRGPGVDLPADPLFQAAARRWGQAPPPGPSPPPPAPALGLAAALVVGVTGLVAALGLSLVAAAGLARSMLTPADR